MVVQASGIDAGDPHQGGQGGGEHQEGEEQGQEPLEVGQEVLPAGLGEEAEDKVGQQGHQHQGGVGAQGVGQGQAGPGPGVHRQAGVFLKAFAHDQVQAEEQEKGGGDVVAQHRDQGGRVQEEGVGQGGQPGAALGEIVPGDEVEEHVGARGHQAVHQAEEGGAVPDLQQQALPDDQARLVAPALEVAGLLEGEVALGELAGGLVLGGEVGDDGGGDEGYRRQVDEEGHPEQAQGKPAGGEALAFRDQKEQARQEQDSPQQGIIDGDDRQHRDAEAHREKQPQAGKDLGIGKGRHFHQLLQ